MPLTKDELKGVIREQWERDEYNTLRQLSEAFSVSADVITRLELTREIVQMAMARLRRKRAAQETLMSILGATRFKTFFHGVLVPTRCPNYRRGRLCGAEDSYEHLTWCYKLREMERKGIESLDFLVVMAKRAIPPVPGTVQTRYVEREILRRRGSGVN